MRALVAAARADARVSILALGYVVLRVFAARGAGAGIYPDSSAYQRIASLPFPSSAFFRGTKPWGAPLLYKMLPGETAIAAPLAQLGISIVAWLVLAVAVSRCLSDRRMREVSFAAVLLFSLSSSIGLWDADLLSESLSLSLLALLVAALLTLARRPTLLLGLAAVAAATLWAGTRDTNAYAVLLLAPLAGAAIWRDGRIRLAVVVAGAFVAAGGTAIAASASTARSELLLVDVVDERVLDEPAARAFFVERGLPVRPNLRRTLFARRSVLTRYEQDPELAKVREWLTRHGGPTYVAYLLEHPQASLVTPLRKLPSILSPNGLDGYTAPGYEPILPRRFDPGRRPGGTALLLLGVLALGTAAVAALRRRAARTWLVPIVLLLISVPQALLVWNGEPIEIGRHGLLVGQTARLALLVLALLMADAACRRTAKVA
jgi:hypothetical protein